LAFHGFHLLRWLAKGDPGYDRTLARLAALDWWFGSRRISPGRLSKRHGAYVKAVKAPAVDFTALNRSWYAEQGARQLSR
jgi:hypothetical protein